MTGSVESPIPPLFPMINEGTEILTSSGKRILIESKSYIR
jgi:hypothetical protein